MDKHLEISWKSLWKIFVMIIFTVALFLLRDTLIILGLAMVISSTLYAPINFLEKKKVPRVLAALTIFIILIAVSGLFLYTITPIALNEFKDFSIKFNKISLPDFKEIGFPQLAKNFNQNLNKYITAIFPASASLFDAISQILGSAVFIISVIVLSLYLSLSHDGVERFLRSILPLNHENYAIDLYQRVRRKMSLWLGGQFILSLTISLIVFLSLLILGVNYSLLIGIVAGILEMVPVAGPIISGVLTFIIASSQSWSLAVSAVILFIVIHQLEVHVLIPLIMKKIIGLHPVIVIIAILAGGQLAGLSGIILAIPAAIVAYEILEDWNIKKHAQ